MSEVKRYEAYLISADTDKVYVRESDYRALEERCAGLERELAHKHRLFIETSGDYDNAEDRIEKLEALLRDAIEDDRVGGGLTVTTIERIEAALAPTETEGDK